MFLARFALREIEGAVEKFYDDCGRYPTQVEGLDALIKRPVGAAGWHGPYVIAKAGALPKDPWEHSYDYRCPGINNPDSFDLSSPGPDETPGTADDVKNW